MNSRIVKKSGNEVIMEVRVLLDPDSMLNSEQQIQQALNDAGKLATGQALSQFDTNGVSIELNGEKYTSKGKKKLRK